MTNSPFIPIALLSCALLTATACDRNKPTPSVAPTPVTTSTTPSTTKTQLTPKTPAVQAHGDANVRELGDAKKWTMSKSVKVSSSMSAHLYTRPSPAREVCAKEKKGDCVMKAHTPIAIVKWSPNKSKPSFFRIEQGIEADFENWSYDMSILPIKGMTILQVRLNSSVGEDNFTERDHLYLFMYVSKTNTMTPLWHGPGSHGGNLQGDCVYGITASIAHRPDKQALHLNRKVKYIPGDDPEITKQCEKPKPEPATWIKLPTP